MTLGEKSIPGRGNRHHICTISLSGQRIHMLLKYSKEWWMQRSTHSQDFSLTRCIPICHQHSLYKGGLIYLCMEFKLPVHMGIWKNAGWAEHWECFWNFTFHLKVPRTQQPRRTHGFCIPVGKWSSGDKTSAKRPVPVLGFSPGLPWRAIKGEVLIF